MSELHRGTVTFLFTDIEGSTKLLTRLGQNGYDELLTAQSELLRAAFAAHDGRVVDTQGDSFFVSFATANDAMAAAVDAQRDLAAHPWPEGATVKVRMGLHTGEPKVGAERYVGIGVHRAARIGSAGHGGQVLLSSTTKELAEEDLPPGITIRDLGQRRLKDIEQPQHVYQLVIEGLENEFAQLKTLDVELRRKRRRMYGGAALIGVVAAAVAIPVFALGQGSSGGGLTVEGNSLALIDPGSNQVVAQVPNVGAQPASIAYGASSLWVANLGDQTVARVDPATRAVTRNIPVTGSPTGLATTPGAVWVVSSNPASPSVSVTRIDPQFDTKAGATRIGNVVPGGSGTVATKGDAVWVAPSSGLLSRLSPKTARIVQHIDPNAGPTAVAIGEGAVWVADSEANTVTRIDPTGLLTPITVGEGPGAIAVGQGGVWVADSLGDSVTRIDPGTDAVTTSITVGADPVGIAVGVGSVWVANGGDGTVTRIDALTASSLKTIDVGGSPQGVVVHDGKVWVTVDRQAITTAPAGSSGGTIRVDAPPGAIDFIDPGLAYAPWSWQLLYETCAKLVDFPDRPAPDGARLIPEVAQALPTRSADGLAYTFKIRKGFRFSPPSNEPVTAETFKYSIERTLSPKLKGAVPSFGFLDDVVGAKAYEAGRTAQIGGLVVRGDTLTFHLLSPEPDLVSRLTMPFFCAVPTGTPTDPSGLPTIPMAGPYFIASYTPGQAVVLERNPNYTGSRPRRPDRIELTIGVGRQKSDAQIEAGTTDYADDGVDPADAPKLEARYGPGSAAAKAGPQRFFVDPLLGLDFLVLNTNRPLFGDLRLRQAVNYAIDRRALARLGSPFAFGGRPFDQYLPSGLFGAGSVNAYPSTPDLAKARLLAGAKRRTAIFYTCNQSPCDVMAQLVKSDLAAIGIDVEVKTFPLGALFEREGTKGEPYDLGFGEWLVDYPDPEDFLNYILEGPEFSTFDDPAFKRKLAAAAKLSGPARYLAYEKLDSDLVRNGAPLASYGNVVNYDFFSARTGCQVSQPVYGIDLGALCIRKQAGG